MIRSNRIKWNRVAKAALNLPDWVEFSLSQRTRYENVGHNWRSGQNPGTNDQLPLLSRIHLGVNQGPFWVMFEGQDSRTHYDEPGDFTRRMVNEFDILQLFGSATFKNVFDTGLRTDFHVGRITLELGKARLIGRNNYPNTTNAFDGGHIALGNDKDWRVRAFLTSPVNRFERQLDESSKKTLFWGTAFESKQLSWLNGEVYYLGISENKDPKRSRHFSTFGAHGYVKEIKKTGDFNKGESGRWYYDFEGIVQDGERRNKDHFAYAGFARIGYSFNVPWIPQVLAEYVYASGSDDPNSGKSQTFDRLFGLRRTGSDLMQTSLYGPFGHSNLEAAGWRLSVRPTGNSRIHFKHHANWLAEAKDAFDGSQVSGGNLQDKTGSSGRWLGHDIELLGEYKFGSNWILSAGYSHWLKGDYFDRLAQLPNRGKLPQGGEKDTDYFFVQSELRF
nr:alginate export family protein [Methylomarinum sp. Ch1-1]MDP4520651.1 alginate export family protein [Methylomarinum sp. Ch1-1]